MLFICNIFLVFYWSSKMVLVAFISCRSPVCSNLKILLIAAIGSKHEILSQLKNAGVNRDFMTYSFISCFKCCKKEECYT